MIDALKDVFHRFGIQPKNISLYEMAFTHASYTNEHRECPSYDRLEFLGDSILDMIVGDFVYQAYPEFNSGNLSKVRAVLVEGKTLTKFSEDVYGFAELVRYSVGEKDNVKNHRHIDEDVFESFIGAVYLDQGYFFVRDLLHQIYQPLLNEAMATALRGDAKSRLQEKVAPASLTYVVVSQERAGTEEVCFTVEARVGSAVLGVGKGHNTKEAEVNSAMDALSKMVGE